MSSLTAVIERKVSRRSALSCGLQWMGAAWVGSILGCESSEGPDEEATADHAAEVVRIAAQRLKGLREGMPLAAKRLGESWVTGARFVDDPRAARRALAWARRGVPGLSRGFSSFFALAHEGRVIRNDQEVDEMAGASLYKPFPELKKGAARPYLESQGVLTLPTEPTGKPDARWVAMAGVNDSTGKRIASYVTGWNWSHYTLRLQNALRESVRSRLSTTKGNMPLLYCFVLVGDAVYSAPSTPLIQSEAIAGLKPMANLSGRQTYSSRLSLEGREFALAVQALFELAPGIGLAVLRSET